MRRFIRISSIALALSLLPVAASALTTASGSTVNGSRTATISDLYIAGGNALDLASTYESDVIVAGGTVTLSGTVAGDLLVAGGTVTVTGEVKGGIKVAAGTVDVNAKVGRNVVLTGGTLTINKSGDVAGEALLAGGSIVVAGHVAKDVNIWGGSVIVNGLIDGNVRIHSDYEDGETSGIIIDGSSVIKGTLEYWAPREANIVTGSTIQGTVTKHLGTSNIESTARDFADTFFAYARLWNLFSLLVVGIFVALLFPRTVRSVGEVMMKRSGASIGWGALVLFAMPIAVIILFATLIGIPLAMLALGFCFGGFYVSQVFLGYLVGSYLIRLIVRRNATDSAVKPVPAAWSVPLGIIVVVLAVDFLLGTAANFLPSLLPFLVGIFRLLLGLWAFGAFLMVTFMGIRDRELRP